MEEQRKIEFRLFGKFQYRSGSEEAWHSLEEPGSLRVGKKQLEFLVYLLVNHARTITSGELIERFWPENTKDPSNSLKNTIHKTRALLQVMFREDTEFLQTVSGGYAWNRDLQIFTDTEQFETLYRMAKTLPDAERIVLEQEAYAMYTEEIQPALSSEWIDHLNTYFRSMYIDLSKSLVLLLRMDERWEDLVRICHRVYMMAPEVEEFTIGYMHALLQSGTPDLAVRHYEEYRTMLREEYGLSPSDQVENVYALAMNFISNSEHFEEELIKQLTQLPETARAYQCNLVVFRNFVQMELRNIIRSPHDSTIVILSIGLSDGAQPVTDVRRAERILLYGLRAGDPFTRLSTDKFVVLLPGASEENAQRVIERITRNFRMTYPKSKAKLDWQSYLLKEE